MNTFLNYNADATTTTSREGKLTTSCNNIVIVLLGGLPGAGKSTLIQQITLQVKHQNDATCWHFIEYDQVQSQVKRDRPQFTDLEAWKLGRQVVLEQLQEILESIHSFNHHHQERHDDITESLLPGNNVSHIIVLEDNFHLASMRKQIYHCIQNYCDVQVNQSCTLVTTSSNDNINSFELLQNQQPSFPIHMALVWLQASLSTCLERNSTRTTTKQVSAETIEKLRQTQQIPPYSGEPWEKRTANLVLSNENDDDYDGNLSSTAINNATELINFVGTVARDYAPVPLPQQDAETTTTFKTTNQFEVYDQVLRKCVGVVGRVFPARAKDANKVRQDVLSSLQLHQSKLHLLPTATGIKNYAGTMFLETLVDAGWDVQQVELIKTNLEDNI